MKAANALYFGDNLEILRRHIDDESVDLVYLDPPFKSDQDYNVLFADKHGARSAAQINAFEDTWHWDQSAEAAYVEVVEAGGRVADVMRAFRTFLGENDMMAYLAMMAPRLLELRRVLKATGSIDLHCDPAASHYLKMLMDSIFGSVNFKNEIIWKRTSAHSSAKRYGPVHDVLLFYAKGSPHTWNTLYESYDETYIDAFYTHHDENGRRWRRSDLTGAGVRHGETGKPWHGIDVTAKGRHWFVPPSELDKLDAEGKIHWPAKQGGVPMLKRYLDEQPGVPLQDVWTDIKPMHNLAQERLGYPTQKPEELLERVILASSNEGDIVLDPFCGCGTTIAVAQRLKRHWIGIDITHLAIALMKHRLRDGFGDKVKYEVKGEPVDLAGAEELAMEDPYQFQFWALGLLGARPTEEKKGMDRGIDGRLYFHDEGPSGKTKQVIFSVKAGKVSAPHVRDLRGVLDREKAEFGVLISLEEPTREMRKEAATAGRYRWSYNGQDFPRLQLLTIKDILGGAKLDIPAVHGNLTFKRAPAAREQDADHGDLFTGRSKLKAKRKRRL